MKKEYQEPAAQLVSFLVEEDVLASGDAGADLGTGHSSVPDTGL